MQAIGQIFNTKNSIAIDKAKDIKAIAIADKNNLKVEDKAIDIMKAVGADKKWLAFYCKVVHRLSEGTLVYILEGSLRANAPANYFAKAANIEIRKSEING